MSITRVASLTVPVFLLAACGGSGGGNPTGPSTPSGPQSSTLSGSASTNGTGGCSPGSHTLRTGAGTITLNVTQASAARVKLQVCHPSAVNHATECTLPPFASVGVGEAVSATLKGGRDQVVAVFPDGCGSPGNPPASSITYTVSVTYPGG